MVIVGGGPGGYAAALYGASAGMHIAMIEEDRVGGTCLNRGCIPAKELLETATVLRTVSHAADFGVTTGSSTLDLSVSQVRKQQAQRRDHRLLRIEGPLTLEAAARIARSVH